MEGRNDREQGFILVLLALSMVVILGSLALVIDIGALMLKRQRENLAVDLGALGASMLRQRGADDDTALHYAQFTATANQFVAHNPRTSDLARELSLTSVTLFDDAEVSGVAIERTPSLGLFFARLLGFHQSELRVQTAAVTEDTSNSKLHAILALDSSVNSLIEYGKGCDEGLSGITCNSPSQRFDYCRPGCAAKLDVIKNFAKVLLDGLREDDVISLIDTAAAARIVFQMQTGLDSLKKADLAAQIDALGVDTFRDAVTGDDRARGYEVWVDPVAALFAAREILRQMESTPVFPAGRDVFFNVTTGIPVHGMEEANLNDYRQWLNGTRGWTGGAQPAGSYSLLQYDGEFGTSLSNILQEGQCPRAFEACNAFYGTTAEPYFRDDDLYYDDDDGPPAADPYLTECAANPVTYSEYLAGLAALNLQDQYDIRLYEVTAGVHEERWVSWVDSDAQSFGVTDVEVGPYASILRDQNFNLDLANDLSKFRSGPTNSLACLGQRRPETNGLHRDLQPSGYSSQMAADELLDHARRSYQPERSMTSIVPHLISAQEASDRGAFVSSDTPPTLPAGDAT